MRNSKNVTGLQKKMFNIKLKLGVFFHFLPEVLKGRISPLDFMIFLRRLLYFFSKMQHNKFVRIEKKTRIDLYIPGFSSRPFYTACRKFMRFGKKFPCSTVLISVTSACRYKCKHCYQKHDLGKDMDINILVRTVKKLQDMGIAFFNIEGGEPFLVYERLKKVCETIDDRSEVWINSTGDGMTLKGLIELKELNVTAIMFSLHHPDPDKFNSFLGIGDAWQTTEEGIELCGRAGIAVALNTCLPRSDFYDGTFEKIMEQAKEFKAVIVQAIKPKPAGGWLESGIEQFTEEDIDRVKRLVNKYNLEPEYRDYPAVSAQVIEEDKDLFGCTAGGTDRFYINAQGDLQPCEFLNISFGNIASDDFETIYQNMRSHFETPNDCWLCEKYSGQVLELFRENNLKALPLSPGLSKTVYEKWDRGKETGLYQKLTCMGMRNFRKNKRR